MLYLSQCNHASHILNHIITRAQILDTFPPLPWLCYLKWRLWCQRQVFQAGINDYIPQYAVGCNYLSLPEIHASDTNVLKYRVTLGHVIYDTQLKYTMFPVGGLFRKNSNNKCENVVLINIRTHEISLHHGTFHQRVKNPIRKFFDLTVSVVFLLIRFRT